MQVAGSCLGANSTSCSEVNISRTRSGSSWMSATIWLESTVVLYLRAQSSAV